MSLRRKYSTASLRSRFLISHPTMFGMGFVKWGVSDKQVGGYTRSVRDYECHPWLGFDIAGWASRGIEADVAGDDRPSRVTIFLF